MARHLFDAMVLRDQCHKTFLSDENLPAIRTD
jgi:hypothetical protein